MNGLWVSVKQNLILCVEYVKTQGEIRGFEFVFRIALHKYDKNALEYIKASAPKGGGRISTRVETQLYLLYLKPVILQAF